MIQIIIAGDGEECDYDDECAPGLVCSLNVRRYESKVSKRLNKKGLKMAKIESMLMGPPLTKKKGKCTPKGKMKIYNYYYY